MKKNRFLKLFYIKSWLYYHNLKFLAKIIDGFIRVLFGCDIPASVKLGKNGIFPHFALGIVIHPRTEIGDNFKIYQNVTIGYRNNEGPPKIGNNCLIGAGACILGNIVIGDNVTIGANAVVIDDVPENSIAVGVPAVVKKIK